MAKYIKMAWRNMWRNWRRTLIASIAIVLGMVLLIFMDAIIRGSDQAIYSNAVRLYGGNVQVHAPGFRDKSTRLPLLPLDDADIVVEKVNNEPNVVNASKRISTGGMVSSREGTYPVSITAIQPESEASVSLVAENISEGRFLNSDDGDNILIGQEMANLLNVSIGDRITLVGKRKDESMRQRSMTIVGIFNLGLGDAEKGLVYINLPVAQTLYNLRDQETEVAITLEEIGQEESLISSLEPELSNYEIDSFYDLRPEIGEVLAQKGAFTTALGFIVLLMASIGILNLMLMAVYERTREMGVLAALGMKGRQLMGLFLLEGMFIGVIGAVLGCIVSWLLVTAFARVGIDYSMAEGTGDITALVGNRIYPSIPIANIVFYGFAVVIIAALASFIPAWQASRNEPAESLHHI
ncbi:MAG: FtsX-like permease family protein [Chloroflexi bacterium]|jgi:ABC-type lipoprotein release transport system permease subunit|nr:FtsX-like permease family protein [Chloroflexota bacterium]